MSRQIDSVVIGATGYVGGELLRLILGHPSLQLAAAISESRAGRRIADTFPNLAAAVGDTAFIGHDAWSESVVDDGQLAVFSAAPHGVSAGVIRSVLDGAAGRIRTVHVVDCSADFRYADAAAYAAVYGSSHGAPELLHTFQSGVPEHVGELKAEHVGHPGCFATAALLAAVPLVGSGLCEPELFINGVTGSTGSGRSPQPGTHHPERHSNLYAYKPLAHRHSPEISGLAEAATGTATRVHFVPHSGPFARGIHVTVSARSPASVSATELRAVFESAYRDSPFISVVDGTPRLKDVVASNRCHIGVAAGDGSVVVMSAIDNLVKGAAGGAVQFMNRLWGLPEDAGLTAPAPGWT